MGSFLGYVLEAHQPGLRGVRLQSASATDGRPVIGFCQGNVVSALGIYRG
jgi:hypothetical protein